MEVLHIPLYDRGMDAALEHVLQTCRQEEKKNRCVSATGAHGIIEAQKNPEFASLLRQFHMNLPDGKPAAVVGKLKGAKGMRQITGPDFFRECMKATASTGITHFFCGGKEGVAEELKRACEENFQNFNVVGCYSPPFRTMNEEELKDLGKRITEVKTDILWIGLSTPKQEFFAQSLLPHMQVHFIPTVGAAFDFHSGRVREAPHFFKRIGMEWFYRLMSEPRRLWKRYFEIVPKFIFFNLMEFVGLRRR
jgi:N-acetylglucosaminyldiphosphoundecaprenol N-acetyl-beta-D-mannosaminyltransferase